MNGESNNEITTNFDSGSGEDDIVPKEPDIPDLVVDILPATSTLGSQITAGDEFYLAFSFSDNGTTGLKKSPLFYTVHLQGVFQQVDSLLYSTVIYDNINAVGTITEKLKFTIPITAPAGKYTVQVTLDKNESMSSLRVTMPHQHLPFRLKMCHLQESI